MNFLSAPLWKIATIGTGILTAILAGLLIKSYFENRELTQQRSALYAEINDPKTGYVVRLAQETTNVETLKVALDTQRRSFEVKAAERASVLANTQRQLADAQARTRTMQLKLDRFLSTKPQGATLEDRIRDIDRRALSEFLP